MDKNKLIKITGKIAEWSLYALILAIPLSKTAVEACITIAFFAWLIKKILLKDFSLKKTPINILLYAFFAATLLSFIHAEPKLLFMRFLISKCLKFIFLYFIIIETIDSQAKLKNILKMALVSAVIVMVDTYIQYYVLHYDLFRHYPSFKFRASKYLENNFLGYPTGPFPFPNDLAAWMLLPLVSAVSIFIRNAKKIHTKLASGLFLFPFAFLFYLTNARSAWLGFVGSFSMILFVQSKKMFIIFLVFLLIMMLILFLLPKDKSDNILGLSSFQDRLYMWRIGWNIFTEHPIVGSGLNSFFSKFKEYREDEYRYKKGSYAHNGFLQMAVDIGLVGLMFFLLLIYKALRIGFNAGKRSDFYGALSLGLSGGLLAFLIHSFFDTNLHSLPLITFFWFGLGILISLKGIYERSA